MVISSASRAPTTHLFWRTVSGQVGTTNAKSKITEVTLITPKQVYQGAVQAAFADHLRAWFATEGRLMPAETERNGLIFGIC